MKNIWKTITFTLASLCVMNSAHAYKYVIYTDETPAKKAEDVVNLMKTTYPFSSLNIEFEIVNLSNSELDCNYGRLDRLVTCKNVDEIQKKAKDRGADQAMIVKKLDRHGGSSAVGSGVPIITSFSVTQTMLHEYLHTIGLMDEYAQPGEETKEGCDQIKSAPNIAFIVPQNPYSGDDEARAKHGRDIPWFGDINSSTPITNSGGTMLGTGKVDFDKRIPVNTTGLATTMIQPVGLYRAKRCSTVTSSKMAWQPGGQTTLMENSQSGFGAPLENIVKKILISKGVSEKMPIVEPPVVEAEINVAAPEVIAPQAKVEVDNSSRTQFKSLFKWINDLTNDQAKTSDR